MANKIQFKRGSNAPASGILSVGEPGFDTANNKFYIGDSTGNPILINEKAEVYAAEESVEVSAEIIDADTLGGHPASDFRLSTWLPTPAQIGAPTTGYGLGTGTSAVTDANNAVNCGWYCFTDGCLNVPFGYGVLMVIQRYTTSEADIQQVAFSTRNSSFEICVRHRLLGAWSEWEYVNPPLKLDVEYPTTERWNGKTVYAKTISYNPGAQIGATGSLTEINIPHGISGFGGGLIRWHGRVNQNGCVLPYFTTNGGITAVTAAGTSSIVLRIYNMTWAAGYTFYITLYYIKN